MQPGDKVIVIDWYYQWQEWHIEGIKEGKYIVVLKNDDWVVNTLLPGKRLDLIKNEYVINHTDMQEIRVWIIKTMSLLKCLTLNCSGAHDLRCDRIKDLTDMLLCLNSIIKNSLRN